MSIQILGADGVTVLTVIPLAGSKNAVHNVVNRDDGSYVNPSFLGKYALSFFQRYTAALAANAGLFAMRNGATRTMKIESLNLSLGFDGTAAATEMNIVAQKMTSATTTPSGGVALGGATGLLGAPSFAAQPQTAGAATTSLADARYASASTALTTTSIITTSPIFQMTLPRGTTGTAAFMDWMKDFELAPNEGLVLSYGMAGVIGDSLAANIIWSEK